MAQLTTNLIVRGESVQSLYSQFRSGNLVVNRRYQRKLVWSVEEKQAFVDSLQQQLPVPLILVAERQGANPPHLEIIDGLQRLDAVFSFINNSFSLDGGYFDLATLAETKEALDAGELVQKQPKLDRALCTRFVGYSLPLSVYRAASDEVVDEVFRRINSGGRHLSRQDLRQAGSTSNFANLVRDLSAEIRGDVSMKDIVDLRNMPSISISSRKQDPGVYIEDVFWVKQRILEREQVRESRDEEIIADILLSTLLDSMPAYDSRILDEVYGLRDDDADRRSRIDAVVLRDSPEDIKQRFMTVYSTFTQIFDSNENSFHSILFNSHKQRVPRYFEAVFLGLEKLVVGEGLELTDVLGARRALKGVGSKHIDIPSGGGTWTANSKQRNTDVVAGILRAYMNPRSGGANPALERNAHIVENILRAAITELSLVEFKQGMSRLSEPPKLDSAIVEEIVRTLSAMANHGKDATGYVIVGIADKKSDAERVHQLGGPKPIEISRKYIVGLNLDINQKGSLDKYLLWFSNSLRNLPLHEGIKSQVLRDMRPVLIEDRTVLLLKVKSLNHPVTFGNAVYDRHGPQTIELKVEDILRLASRFK